MVVDDDLVPICSVKNLQPYWSHKLASAWGQYKHNEIECFFEAVKNHIYVKLNQLFSPQLTIYIHSQAAYLSMIILLL